MTRHIEVSISWFRAIVAFQTALCASALTLALLRWPVATGVLLAAGVSVLMLVSIYQIVTSGHQVKPVAPVRNAAATVDGVPVKNVEVMQ